MILPRILCGPILRRCDPKLVTVWLATSYELPVKAHIAIAEIVNKSVVRIPTRPEKRTVRVGENIWVHLLLARPRKGTFPGGKLLAYDLDLGSGPLTIQDRDFRNLVYHSSETRWMPTFFLQAQGEPIRIMQGSCRKPYGMGVDTLAAADTLIARNPANLKVTVSEKEGADKGRPAVLFLTGDQIYADDVEEVLFEFVRELSVAVMGSDESIPHQVAGSTGLSELTFGKKRKDFALDKVRFTTEDGEGHLLGLGEYVAMYLAVWSQTVWDSANVSKLADERWRPGTPTGADRRKASARVRDMYTTLPAVRRALANTPTYMIFDDHDVTDDWNMNSTWHDAVAKSIPGRRVVANALAAYWLFQAWGNDPDHFEPAFVATIQNYCDHKRERGSGHIYPASDIPKDFVELLWNYHDWSFAAPTEPIALFADMRTERELFPPPIAPMLMSRDALKKLAKLAADAGYRENSPLILISPAPVFNISGIDMGQVVMKSLKEWALKVELVDLDWEQWSNNPLKKAEFLRFIIETLKPSFCVFLSGEVHFGVTAAVDYYLDPPYLDVLSRLKVKLPADRCGRFVQLTSSALKNENAKAATFFVKKGVTDLIPSIDMNEERWALVGTPWGPAQMPSGLSKMMSIQWVEIGRNFRDTVTEAYAPVNARCNLGVVTVDQARDRVVHEFCVIDRLQPFVPGIREGFSAVPSTRSLTFDAGRL